MDNYKRILIVAIIIFIFVAIVVILTNLEKKDITGSVSKKGQVIKQRAKVTESPKVLFDEGPGSYLAPQQVPVGEEPQVTEEAKKPPEKVTLFDEESEAEEEDVLSQGSGAYEDTGVAKPVSPRAKEQDKIIKSLPKGVILY